MCVKHIGQSHVLLAAIEFLRELEEVNGNLVVKVQEFAVFTDHI